MRVLQSGSSCHVRTLLYGTFHQLGVDHSKDVIDENVGHEVLIAGLHETAEVQRPPQKFEVVICSNRDVKLWNEG